jgi:uncharacterized membrane protein YedE/YeeE
MPARSSIRRRGKQSRPFMTDLSVDARLLASDRGLIPHINPAVVTFASALLAAGALALANAYTWRQGALFLLGGALGVALYHALFGFTSAWRVFIADGRGAGLRAQMLMLAVAVLLFFPALAHGSLFGQAVHGEYGAVGVSVLAGAFLFGLGMQLGGGCASGTLYTAGGGNTRMLVTLFFFIAGSALGAWHLPWWSAQPNVGQVSLISAWGWLPALLISFIGFAGIAGFTVFIERRQHGALLSGVSTDRRGWRRFLHGPWPLLAGAVALAFGNFATLYLAGRPWGITSAFSGVQRSSPAWEWTSPPGDIGKCLHVRMRCAKACLQTSHPSWTLASCSVPCLLPVSPASSSLAGKCRRARSSRPSSADYCSAMARAWLMAATSAPISAELHHPAFTAGCGSLPPSWAASWARACVLGSV